MKTIWKYQLGNDVCESLKIPKGGEILTLKLVNGSPFIWALVDPDAPMVERNFAIYGTGHPIDATNGVYIGTYVLNDGLFVWHVFELV